MSNEQLLELKMNVDYALSGLRTLTLAYGFNNRPMRKSAKELLPCYSNQIADMIGIVSENLTNAKSILKEVEQDE